MTQKVKQYYENNAISFSKMVNNTLKDNPNWEIFKMTPMVDNNRQILLVVFNVHPIKKRLIEDFNPFESTDIGGKYSEHLDFEEYTVRINNKHGDSR